MCHASRKLTLSSWHGFVLKWYCVHMKKKFWQETSWDHKLPPSPGVLQICLRTSFLLPWGNEQCYSILLRRETVLTSFSNLLQRGPPLSCSAVEVSWNGLLSGWLTRSQGFWWQCNVYSDTRDDRLQLLTSWGTIQFQKFFFLQHTCDHLWRECCSSLIVLTWSLVTGGRGSSPKKTSWPWSCPEHFKAHSALETHCFLPDAGCLHSTEKLLDKRWRKGKPGQSSSCPVSDSCNRHGESLAAQLQDEQEVGGLRSPALPPRHTCYPGGLLTSTHKVSILREGWGWKLLLLLCLAIECPVNHWNTFSGRNEKGTSRKKNNQTSPLDRNSGRHHSL